MRSVKSRSNLRQSGHVATEWTLIMLILFVVLFAPMPGSDKSVTSYFMDSIRDYHKNSSFIYSLP
jgi:hypothetical protein